MNKKLEKAIGKALTASVATGLLAAVPVKAADLSNDQLYKNAYQAVQKAKADGTQKSINEARQAIAALKGKVDWAIGEFSKQVDSVQGPKLSAIVKAINTAKASGKQADIDAAKALIDPDLAASYKNSYSAAVDAVQTALQNKVIEAKNQAIKTQAQADIDAAKALIAEVKASKNPKIAAWAATVEQQLIAGTAKITAVLSANTTKSLKVKFNKAVDTAKATFAVKNGNVVVNTVATWNTDKTEATLTSSIALATGNYTVTVGGLGMADADATLAVVVAPERIDVITLDAAAFGNGTAGQATLGYKVVNQYGEDITKTVNTANLVVTSSKGTGLATISAAGTILLTGLGTDKSVTVTVIDKVYAKTVTSTVTVSEAKSISEVTLGAVQIKTGKTQLVAGDVYELTYSAKDQYGNEVKLASTDISKLTFVTSDSAAFDPASAMVDGNGKLFVTFKTFSGLKNVSITAIVNATGKSSTTTAAVYGTATADQPTLVAPSTRFGKTDTAFKVQLTMKDQYGNDMKADDIVSAASGLTITSGNTSVFDLNAVKVTKDGDKAVVQLDAKGLGTANLTVTVNATGKSVTLPITVVEAKVASTISLTPDYTYAVKGGAIVLKATFKDQYGDEIKTSGSAVKFTADKNDFAAAPGQSTVTDMVATGVTLTAADYDKSSKYTVTLYAADGVTVLDTKEIVLTSVKADAALTYAINDLGTVAAASYNDANYEKAITVYAKDASGNKVALPSTGVIQAVSSVDVRLDPTALGLNKIKAKAFDSDGVANFNVVVATNTGVQTLSGSVTLSKIAPSATKIEAKNASGVVTKVTVATNATVNFLNAGALQFVVTDQYGQTALSTGSNVSFFVQDTTGAVNKVDNTNSYKFTVAGTYKVTAVTSNGLSVKVEVTVQ